MKYLKPNPHAEWSREYLEYKLNQYFAQNISYHPEGALAGKKYTLILICILTASSFLLKNLFIYLGKHVLAPIRTEMIPIKFGTKPFKHLSGFQNLTGV